MLWPVNDDEQMSHLLAGGLVDGALLMEVQIRDSRVERLVASGIPFALIGRTENDDLPYVDIDFATTIHEAVAHLRSYGHERIALITDRARGGPGPGRIMRVESAYREAIAPARRAARESSRWTARRRAGGRPRGRCARNIPGARPPSSSTEGASAGLAKGIRAAGRAIPGDLSIISASTTRELGEMIEPENPG
ncbi:hypothetical protein GCM10020220_007810 [Nonomuraea rubra]